MCFVKRLANYVKYVLNNLPFWQSMTKPQQTNEHIWEVIKSLNSYSLVKYNKIYPNTNSWKTLQEESLWQVDFDNLYFWNTLNKAHQGILVWNRNIRLHTLKKHVYKEKKETTNVRIGERNIHQHIKKISTMYVKWS